MVPKIYILFPISIPLLNCPPTQNSMPFTSSLILPSFQDLSKFYLSNFLQLFLPIEVSTIHLHSYIIYCLPLLFKALGIVSLKKLKVQWEHILMLYLYNLKLVSKIYSTTVYHCEMQENGVQSCRTTAITNQNLSDLTTASLPLHRLNLLQPS